MKKGKILDNALVVTTVAILLLNVIILFFWGASQRERKMQDAAYELFTTGQRAVKLNDFESAVYYFSQVANEYPWSTLAENAQLQLADVTLINQRKINQAVTYYKEYLKKFPQGEHLNVVKKRLDFIEEFKGNKDGLIDYLKGHRLMKAHDYRGALFFFKRVIDRHTDSEIAWLAAGKYKKILKQYPGLANQ